MSYIALGLGVVVALEAMVIVGFALRHGGLKTDAMDADQKRTAAEEQLKTTAKEFNEYKKRTRNLLSDLRSDIEELEGDLEQCATPGARRSRLERLLSKATDGEDDNDSEDVP